MRDAEGDYFDKVTLTAHYACATGLSMNLVLTVTVRFSHCENHCCTFNTRTKNAPWSHLTYLTAVLQIFRCSIFVPVASSRITKRWRATGDTAGTAVIVISLNGLHQPAAEGLASSCKTNNLKSAYKERNISNNNLHFANKGNRRPVSPYTLDDKACSRYSPRLHGVMCCSICREAQRTHIIFISKYVWNKKLATKDREKPRQAGKRGRCYSQVWLADIK